MRLRISNLEVTGSGYAAAEARARREITHGWNDERANAPAQMMRLGSQVRQSIADSAKRALPPGIEQDARRFVLSSMRYFDEFMGLRCAPDLLALGVFPNTKEITETFGAYNAVRSKLHPHGWHLSDPEIVAVFPGDGSTPRTAATFAFRTRWTCHSVDPRVRPRPAYAAVDRLHVHKMLIQDFRVSARRVVVVAVHSHAKLDATLDSIDAEEIAVVAMPCCTKLLLGREPDFEYRDLAVLSPQNVVRVWRCAT